MSTGGKADDLLRYPFALEHLRFETDRHSWLAIAVIVDKHGAGGGLVVCDECEAREEGLVWNCKALGRERWGGWGMVKGREQNAVEIPLHQISHDLMIASFA